MENWKKILIAITSFVIVLFIGGFCLYNYYIVPQYIEPALQLASDAIKDTDIQQILTDMADELVEEGVLNQYTAKTYIRKANQYNRSSKNTEDTDELDDLLNSDNLEGSLLDSENGKNSDKDNESMIIAFSSKSNIGIETINSDASKDSSNTKPYSTYSEKQDYIEKNQDNDINLEYDDYLLNSQNDMIGNMEGDQNVSDLINKQNKLYNKVINAMNSHERSVFYKVLTKISVAELKDLYANGDKDGIKYHLKSRLDESLYKEAVSIFYKYASLLYE